MTDRVANPIEGGDETLEMALVRLNDVGEWALKEIADWLTSLGY